MGMVIVPLIGVTASGGTATIRSDRALDGFLWGLQRYKGTHDDGADLTLTVVNSNFTKTIITLTNADTDAAEWYPRASSCGATGTSNSDNMILIPVIGHLQLAVAQGGNAKTGGLYAIILE